MKLNSNEMISRATERTSRALYTCFGGFYLIHFTGHTFKTWNILGQELPQDFFVQALILLFGFLIVSHTVHWLADYIAYTKWFDRNTPTNSEPDEILKMEATESPSHALVELIHSYKEEADGHFKRAGSDPLTKQSIETFSENVERLDRKFSDLEKLENRLGKNFAHLTVVARLVIVFWYFLIPIGLAGFALYHLIFG